jgi:hypothetical protein
MYQEIADEYAIIMSVLREHALSLTVTLYPDCVQLISVKSELGDEEYTCPFENTAEDNFGHWLHNAADEIERTRRNKPERLAVRCLRKMISWLEDENVVK